MIDDAKLHSHDYLRENDHGKFVLAMFCFSDGLSKKEAIYRAIHYLKYSQPVGTVRYLCESK